MFMATMSKITKLKANLEWLNKLQNACCGTGKQYHRRIINDVVLTEKNRLHSSM
jgi:hypothetical protein